VRTPGMPGGVSTPGMPGRNGAATPGTGMPGRRANGTAGAPAAAAGRKTEGTEVADGTCPLEELRDGNTGSDRRWN
jgi:hypothetical protein